jgi:hypothetical protein
MMNPDQHANIDEMVKAICETLYSAWSYFHLLEGFHKGSKSYPIVVQKFDRLFAQIWRAAFDALIAKAGTLIDRNKTTYSLPNLLTMVHRYRPQLKSVAKEVEDQLTSKDGPLAKIESWRHQAIAHRTPSGRTDGFYKNNKMYLGEVAEGLRQLERLLNMLSMEILHVHNETETDSEILVQQGADLFACIASQQAE